jgi:phage baseplate assembly protein W
MRVFRVPLQLTQGSFITTTDYATVVHDQIVNALMTNRGERVFRSQYGMDFLGILFDPSDELSRQDGANQIMTKLSTLVPRAIIRSVTVTVDPLQGSEKVFIQIIWRAAPSDGDRTLSLPVNTAFLVRGLAIT